MKNMYTSQIRKNDDKTVKNINRVSMQQQALLLPPPPRRVPEGRGVRKGCLPLH
jgi:hypothetical protein